MRIALATQNYFQPNNGQATFVRHLAEGLAAEGQDVMVIAPASSPPAPLLKERGGQTYNLSAHDRAHSEAQCNPRVETVPSLPLTRWYPDVYITLRPAPAVARLLTAFQPDVVHIQDHFPLCRAVAQAARGRGLPLLATNHFLPDNILPFVPVLSRSAWCRAWLERRLWGMVRAVFDLADRVTAPTETAAAILRQQGLRAPVCAVSCGVDLDAFVPDPTVPRAVVRQRYGLSADTLLAVFVGRVDREKRLDVLLEAMRILDRADVQLAIVGRGRERAALQARAARLGLGGRVVFPGFLPPEDLRALLNSADLFVMPGEAELQSIATLEAMAVGLPVLAANARALPELVEEGVNGGLFQAGSAESAAQALERLAAARDRLSAMGAVSLAKARSHALCHTIRRYAELYRAIQPHS